MLLPATPRDRRLNRSDRSQRRPHPTPVAATDSRPQKVRNPSSNVNRTKSHRCYREPGRAGQDREELADVLCAVDWVGEGEVGVDGVVVASSVALGGAGQLGDDAVRGAFGDPDPVGLDDADSCSRRGRDLEVKSLGWTRQECSDEN